MATTFEHPWPFLLVCLPERRQIYEPLLGQVGLPVHILNDCDQALQHCIRCPPLALMADVMSVARMGQEESAWLSNICVSWPVMRCTVNGAGNAMAMCVEPAHRGPLVEALNAIAAGDAVWKHPRYQRRFLRIDLFCRVRLIKPDGTSLRTNTMDVSPGGMFVLGHEEVSPGTELDVELQDLADTPLQLRCRVAHVRHWDDGPHPPGLGLVLVDGDRARFCECLATPVHVVRFRRSVT